VLGQAHTPRRRLFPLAAALVAVLAAPALVAANASHGTTMLRARDAAIVAKSRAAVLGLYALDTQLVAVRTQLQSLDGTTRTLRAERASLERQLAVARRSTRIAQARVADRLRALYEQQDVSPLEVVLGARNLDEAVTSLDNLQRVTGQSEDVLRGLTAARASLLASARALAAREAALAAATREARATEQSLVRARAARRAYIESLAAERRLTQRQISAVVARARAAQRRSEQLTHTVVAPVTRAADAPSAPPVATVTGPGRTLTVSATGYSMAGHTASGLPVGIGIVAVDPSVIPLGTHMVIPGYGDAVAADTGGSVAGNSIDLWFPTVAQANAWGRRVVTITLR